MEIWLRGSFFSPGHNTSLSVTNDIEAVLRKIEYWHQGSIVGFKILYHDEQGCPAPRLFVGTGQVQRRIISWELARGARDNLTMGRA